MGAGIQNAGTLFLSFVTVTGNTATLGQGGGLAITFTGRARVAYSLFQANSATSANGGGAIYNAGRLTLLGSNLTGNNSAVGGGVSTDSGATTRIIRSTIERNTSAQGGGVYNQGSTSLDRTLVRFNNAPGGGGGLFNSAPGAIFVSRSIIENNTPDNEEY